ncbi:MAG TPA: hypothetical protein PLR90_03675 [Methylophilus sp.]|nr:hypothetical protein [Methylophilus sp.]HQQ32996.1 hypothetical protein [Methylophilus sp.]
MSLRRLILISLLLYGTYHYLSHREIRYGAGVLAPEEPVQLDTEAEPFDFKDYIITPLNEFEITARVLSISNYHADKGAAISPTDLALGWGRMSDETILDQIDIRQSGRFYYWHVKSFPIPRKEIETHSANMHLVPENSLIAEQLKDVRVGQLVSIKGYLIKATGQNGFVWKSSQTRHDTGSGACELIFVKSLHLS